MKEAVLCKYCEDLYRVYEIPIRIFRGYELVQCHENLPLESSMNAFLKKEMSELLGDADKNFALTVSEGIFAYALIRNIGTDFCVVIGPTRSMPINEDLVKRIIQKNGYPMLYFDNLYAYLSSIHILQHGRFVNHATSVYEALNDDIPEIDTLQSEEMQKEPLATAQSNALKHLESLAYGFSDKIDHYDSEQRILSYIANGMTEQIKIFWREADVDKNVPNTPEALRIIKNNCIVSIALITRAALSSTLNPEDVLTLRNVYIEQTEKCTNVPQVLHLRYDVMIEFAQRIRASQCSQTGHPTIDRVISFIQQHISDKIRLDDLAALAHTHKVYLSKKFKEEMGIGIVDYINKQKVNEAKRFLKFTDKTLIEISNYFSFTSQRYIQKNFKDFTGMTPNEYRNLEPF